MSWFKQMRHSTGLLALTIVFWAMYSITGYEMFLFVSKLQAVMCMLVLGVSMGIKDSRK